jgi:hypothetical protein
VIDVRVSDLNYGNHLGHDALVSFFKVIPEKISGYLGVTNDLIKKMMEILG